MIVPQGLWKSIEVQESFLINVPNDSEYLLDDDESTFVIKLRTEPETEVRIGEFPFEPKVVRNQSQKKALEKSIRFFFESSIPKATGKHLIKPDLEISECKNMYICRVIGMVNDEQFWAVRGYCKKKGDNYFLIHWNGPRKYLIDTVFPILESFTPR